MSAADPYSQFIQRKLSVVPRTGIAGEIRAAKGIRQSFGRDPDIAINHDAVAAPRLPGDAK